MSYFVRCRLDHLSNEIKLMEDVGHTSNDINYDKPKDLITCI